MCCRVCHARAAECLNFLKLCKIKYFNFCRFHRVLVWARACEHVVC